MYTFAQESKVKQRTASAMPARNRFEQSRRGDSSLATQRLIGNQEMQRPTSKDAKRAEDGLATTRPLRFGPDFSPLPASAATPAMAGDQAGEPENSVLGGDPDTTTAAPQPQAGTLGGDATSISTSNLDGPTWRDNGEFKWWVRWVTDGTSGWIVQKIENTYSGTRADGTAITNASVGVEPVYYEAWEVASNGTITGSLGATGNRDRWERPALGPLGSWTSFSMTGTVYWTAADPAASGFRSRAVSNAGSLLSSLTAPAGIGSPLLTRAAYGRWAADGTQALPGCFVT